ncbi:MAG TPA: TQO small subunit DoxD, partial [Chloroflexota bacterium]
MAPRPGQNFYGPPAADPLQSLATLPLRLFLGVTFAYAGLQKIADPGYLDPTSGTYLGSQLLAFAMSSPIGFLIQAVAVPNVQLVGQAVIVVELGVGILVIAGLLTRFAAAIGALLSLVLFLSATWDVQPYFLGSDTIYTVAWTTMALVGDRGVFSLQAFLRERLRAARAPRTAKAPAAAPGFDRRTLLLRAGAGLVGFVWLLAILPKGRQALAAAADAPAASTPPPSNPFRAESSLNGGPTAQPSSAGVAAAPSVTSTPLPFVPASAPTQSSSNAPP